MVNTIINQQLSEDDINFYKIDFLDKILTVCVSLRKMKNIIVVQDGIKKRLRAQLHPLIVSPFGTFKSTMTESLHKVLNKDLVKIDDFTKASVEGSISRDGDYVPSLLTRCGGKILVIDEWNSVDYYGQRSLLGVLENQAISRTLGFKVKRPFKQNNKFVNYEIADNWIQGNIYFSSVAYAMEYPVVENSQVSKAILSRFSPLFIEPTLDLIKKGLMGRYKITINDYSSNIENIEIDEVTYEKYQDKFWDFVHKNNLVPMNEDDFGYLSRCSIEILRLGIVECMKDNKNKKVINITDVTYFEKQFCYIYLLLRQYTNPRTKGKIDQYRELLEMHAGEEISFYAKRMGVNRKTIWEWNKKLEGQKR